MARTAMLTQYEEAKEEAGDAILLFHLGDFYETFYDDAEVASDVCGITLTSRPQGDERIPMAGVPVSKAERYVQRLLEAGHKVAICEQVEDADASSGIVRREITEIVTPGTVSTPGLLEERTPTHLLAVAPIGDDVGLAWADASTGRLVATDAPVRRLGEEVARVAPAEIVHPDDLASGVAAVLAEAAPDATRTARAASLFVPRDGARRTREELEVATLEAFGFEGDEPCIGAVGALLDYLRETKRSSLAFLERIERFERSTHLALCRRSRGALELVSAGREGGRTGSLLWRIDRTSTAMGGRRLREWLLAPLADPGTIGERQDAVEALAGAPDVLEVIREELGRVDDLERLAVRLGRGRSDPRDIEAIRLSLERVPPIREALRGLDASLLRETRDRLDPLDDLVGRIARTLVDDPPQKVGDGGLIRDGVSEDLDAQRAAGEEGREWLAELEAREREATDIPSLKIGHNKVFGYYIEVTRTHLEKVPEEWDRRQTLKSCERYTHDELRELEGKIVSAGDRARALEVELFRELQTACEERASAIRAVAARLADLDALVSLADLAREPGWVRPEVTGGTELAVEAGRHPVLEETLDDPFVPNDLELAPGRGDGPRLLVITGPNMAGKSTYIRQTALVAILAQMGSWVPAEAATVGAADRIFTRVGASDEIGQGLSTFMVEMIEAADILHHATERSLVVLDELGRGTSTYDGLALAWAIAERLVDDPTCRTLFATHYHELTALADARERVENRNVLVEEDEGGIRFLHRIGSGAAGRSYGIHVAGLAGVPDRVVDRARAILGELEDGGGPWNEGDGPAPPRSGPGRAGQLRLGGWAEPSRGHGSRSASGPSPGDDDVRTLLRRLRETDVLDTTPMDALGLLQELKELASAVRTG